LFGNADAGVPIVTLANVILFSVDTELPSWIAVLPNVIVVAKLASSCANGIVDVAFANILGTGI
jgi:hypothetical protein